MTNLFSAYLSDPDIIVFVYSSSSLRSTRLQYWRIHVVAHAWLTKIYTKFIKIFYNNWSVCIYRLWLKIYVHVLFEFVYLKLERTAGVSWSLKLSTVVVSITVCGSKFHWIIVRGKYDHLYVSLEVWMCLYVWVWFCLVLLSVCSRICDGMATRQCITL